MPARTGQEYLNGLRDRPREVHIRGQRVADVTSFPGLANGASTVANTTFVIESSSNQTRPCSVRALT